ncbi:MAG TPA: CcoQ/FixQ family Cbb3-type cytochrome c oxidase assembly chaperone [Hyphomonadaceae bacterium]|nr:CcoQ/FixQ family Cbb3-type cytochrome c oxidase assembly chaperone [Hyphomonadaceae bacterium]
MTYTDVAAFSQQFGLVYMVVLFLATVLYALWPRNKAKFDHAARMPLQEED